MEVGLITNNNLKYININLLAENLGMQLCKALPAFHAFTGCDYFPAFVGRGKKRPLSILLTYTDVQLTLSEIGENENVTDESVKGLETFASMVYNKNKCTSTDDAIFESFLQAYKPKTNSKHLLKVIHGTDGSSFPPCFKILHQHILRTNYISFMGNDATKPKIQKCNIE